MSKLMYNSANKLRFTDISEKYAVPRTYKAKLSSVHGAVVEYVMSHYKNTRKYRQTVVDALNYLTYCIIQSQPPVFSWVKTDPLNTMPNDVDWDDVENELNILFLTEDAIDWNVSPVEELIVASENNDAPIMPLSQSNTISPKSDNKTKGEEMKSSIDLISNPVVSSSNVINKPLKTFKQINSNTVNQEIQKVAKVSTNSELTPKEDLYIQPPKYPRFDFSKIWLNQTISGDQLIIYTTLPEIPTKQNEISVTTNPNMITDNEYMSLYPNQFIRTRSTKMYERIEGIPFDEEIGSIIPINGFSEKQILDNIIRYPHFYKLRKVDQKGEPVNFYKSLEINGELHSIDEVWDSLPESKVMPRDSEFVKEYVVRRYLLEESIGIEHRYKLYGTLDPFLTLFMPASSYVNRGYTDALGIVKQCVKSRISYKQSRNPILRRLSRVNGN